MPKFTIRLRVTNNSGAPVKAHVGASLVGKDWMEFYNTLAGNEQERCARKSACRCFARR